MHTVPGEAININCFYTISLLPFWIGIRVYGNYFKGTDMNRRLALTIACLAVTPVLNAKTYTDYINQPSPKKEIILGENATGDQQTTYVDQSGNLKVAPAQPQQNMQNAQGPNDAPQPSRDSSQALGPNNAGQPPMQGGGTPPPGMMPQPNANAMQGGSYPPPPPSNMQPQGNNQMQGDNYPPPPSGMMQPPPSNVQGGSYPPPAPNNSNGMMSPDGMQGSAYPAPPPPRQQPSGQMPPQGGGMQQGGNYPQQPNGMQPQQNMPGPTSYNDRGYYIEPPDGPIDSFEG